MPPLRGGKGFLRNRYIIPFVYSIEQAKESLLKTLFKRNELPRSRADEVSNHNVFQPHPHPFSDLTPFSPLRTARGNCKSRRVSEGRVEVKVEAELRRIRPIVTKHPVPSGLTFY